VARGRRRTGLVGRGGDRPPAGLPALRGYRPPRLPAPADRGVLALRVRDAPLVGVSGTLYAPRRWGLACLGPATLAYDDPRVMYLQAAQLMRGLRDRTVVDLDRV
jgi:hypothetical protein